MSAIRSNNHIKHNLTIYNTTTQVSMRNAIDDGDGDGVDEGGRSDEKE